MADIFDSLNETSQPNQIGDKIASPKMTKKHNDIFDSLEPENQQSFSEDFKKDISSPEQIPFEQGLGQVARGALPALGSVPRNFYDIATIPGKFLFDLSAPYLGLPSSKELPEAGSFLPTSEDIEKKFDELTKDQFKPESEFEKRMQKGVGTAVSLMVPTKGNIPFVRAIGSTIAGEIAGETAKKFKLSDKKQEYVKDGATFLASIFNPKAAESYMNSLYDKFRKSISQSTPINTQNLNSELQKFRKSVEKGLGEAVSEKASVLKAVDALEKKSASNFMPLEDLIESKIDINRIMGEPETLKGAKKKLKELQQIANKGVDQIGKTNPESLKLYRTADNVFQGIEESKKFSRLLANVIKKQPVHSLGAAGALYYTLGGPVALKYAAQGYAALKGFEFLHRISTNKNLSAMYFNMIKEGALQNQESFAKHLRRLDEAAEKDD